MLPFVPSESSDIDFLDDQEESRLPDVPQLGETHIYMQQPEPDLNGEAEGYENPGIPEHPVSEGSPGTEKETSGDDSRQARLYVPGEYDAEIPSNFFDSTENKLEILSEVALESGGTVILNLGDLDIHLKVEARSPVEIPGRVIYFVRLMCHDVSVNLESALQDFLATGGRWGRVARSPMTAA